MTPELTIETFWAVVTAIALIAVIALLLLGVWAVVQKLRAYDPLDWANDCPGVDVLGDGGRRLD